MISFNQNLPQQLKNMKKINRGRMTTTMRFVLHAA